MLLLFISSSELHDNQKHETVEGVRNGMHLCLQATILSRLVPGVLEKPPLVLVATAGLVLLAVLENSVTLAEGWYCCSVGICS